jgi:sugar lactone lactonase YvrE
MSMSSEDRNSKATSRTMGRLFVVLLCGAGVACSSSDNPGGPSDNTNCAATDAQTETSVAPMSDAALTSDAAPADPFSGLPAQQAATFTTLFKSPLVIEGLTGDISGNLYAAGRGGNPCPVYRVSPTGVMATVGTITAPCSPNGLTFNPSGDLFIGDGDKVYRLTPNDQTPPVAAVFASGVPGANGLAFDKSGNLWVSDGTTGQGRVWKVAADSTVSEAFRVQPLANSVNVVTNADAGVDIGGIGRDPRALPPGSLTITPTTRTAADTAGSVPIVANGLAFAPDGTLFIADTARGAIWRVVFDAEGAVASATGCDTTFMPNTLCLDDLLVQHPILEGLDGIVLDAIGNIWGVANERNAVVVVSAVGAVRQVFRNVPDATSQLRNGGPLEFPTSPFLVDRKLCVTQSDVSRRDNFPNAAGEVKPAGPELAKLSCLVQPVPAPGLVLPVH